MFAMVLRDPFIVDCLPTYFYILLLPYLSSFALPVFLVKIWCFLIEQLMSHFTVNETTVAYAQIANTTCRMCLCVEHTKQVLEAKSKSLCCSLLRFFQTFIHQCSFLTQAIQGPSLEIQGIKSWEPTKMENLVFKSMTFHQRTMPITNAKWDRQISTDQLDIEPICTSYVSNFCHFSNELITL